MTFLVDTDIASSFIRKNRLVRNRFRQHAGQVSLSAISVAELKVWLHRTNTPPKFVNELPALLQQVQVVLVDDAVAQRAGLIGAGLLDLGLTIAMPDLLIAATALLLGLVLVTHNTQDFAHVPGLTVVGWLVP
jgi:tRNA(fMet)-specific endonuclease VapC